MDKSSKSTIVCPGINHEKDAALHLCLHDLQCNQTLNFMSVHSNQNELLSPGMCGAGISNG